MKQGKFKPQNGNMQIRNLPGSKLHGAEEMNPRLHPLPDVI